ncbi:MULTISPECIES: hypothetical protein [Halobacillus]|uniref:hypothetical protein n=1 Tax=Halobacillus TaxID=45667 RepID=UPI00136BD7C7|nr:MULTISPECIES: hypothetical protein [Halobacillus]MYL31205.1 hypothetical protein [Halobacillus halophilus]MYL39992.1 hypothetical protein [Halobacillus litoralis]
MKKIFWIFALIFLVYIMVTQIKEGFNDNDVAYSSLTDKEITEFLSKKKFEPSLIESINNETVIIFEKVDSWGFYSLMKQDNEEILSNKNVLDSSGSPIQTAGKKQPNSYLIIKISENLSKNGDSIVAIGENGSKQRQVITKNQIFYFSNWEDNEELKNIKILDEQNDTISNMRDI